MPSERAFGGAWQFVFASISASGLLWRYPQQAVMPLIVLVAGGVVVIGSALYLLAVPASVIPHKDTGQESRLWSLTSGALHSDVVHEWVVKSGILSSGRSDSVIFCGWIWLLVRAFWQRRAWGWSSLFLPPAGLAFAARHPRRGAPPLILVILAALVAAVPAVYILCVQVDLGPRDKNVNGERHVTLTGRDRNDY